MMNITLIVLIGISSLIGPAAQAGEPADPEQWFRSDYAQLWANQPSSEADALLAFYADEIVTHGEDGSISSDGKREWLLAPMAGWVADGWLRAELNGLKVHPINATTVAFTALWQDHYASGEREDSCGWYLANAIGGKWMITAYADTSCALHDFE